MLTGDSTRRPAIVAIKLTRSTPPLEAPGFSLRAKAPGLQSGETRGTTPGKPRPRQQGARVTRRLSPHSEHTPYSLTNPPVRAIRVAARWPVDGSIPTARPRHRSQKNRPRWASRKAATLSLAIMAGGWAGGGAEAPPEPDGQGVRAFIGGRLLLDGHSASGRCRRRRRRSRPGRRVETDCSRPTELGPGAGPRT